MKSGDRNFLLILLGIYLAEFSVLAVAPYQRSVWLAENAVAGVTVLVLAWMYRCGVRFSRTAWLLMAGWIFLQTLGGHYTFERVPFGWITDLLGAERNHFDRLCHFWVGFFAWPALEFIEERKLCLTRFAAVFFVVMSIFGFAAIFELIEWIYAEIADPSSGTAFLGSQGDLWDAQKDMLADGLGAIASSTVYCLCRRRQPEVGS
ncbi:MAG: DUF2238 domain-containing protein [Lentisphaeria bacterium]|nr:DUF2238 domain-containing protein [Lentisphaeria bacterium]